MIHENRKSSVEMDHEYWQQPITTSDISSSETPGLVGDEDYRLPADAIPALCWIAQGDGSIYWYNRRWHDYCGSPPQSVEGWGWQSVHDPLELPKVVEKWKRAIQKGEAFEMTFPLRGADGMFRQFLTRIVPVLNKAGVIVRWVGTNTEFGSENSAKEALAVSEAKFRVLTDALPQLCGRLKLMAIMIITTPVGMNARVRAMVRRMALAGRTIFTPMIALLYRKNGVRVWPLVGISRSSIGSVMTLENIGGHSAGRCLCATSMVIFCVGSVHIPIFMKAN